MKVKYICKKVNRGLTYNKVYDAKPMSKGYILVINDSGMKLVYGNGVKDLWDIDEFSWFIDVTQEERDKNIDKILE